MNKKKLSMIACASMLSFGIATAQDWNAAGNALNATGKLGTTSNQDINFISNSVVYGVLTKTGRWGFGTTFPSAKFQINSACIRAGCIQSASWWQHQTRSSK